MLVADVDLRTIRQRHDGDRLGFRVQRMYGLQTVQDDVESRTAECERTIHLNIDARRRFIEICEDQHLAIAHSEDNAGPPTGFLRCQVSMGFDNEARDQAW